MRIVNIPLAIKELGGRSVFFNFLYRLGLLSGYYRLKTPPGVYDDWGQQSQSSGINPGFSIALLSAVKPGKAACRQILEAADEIIQGTTRLYGAIPTPIQFNTPYTSHWTRYELGREDAGAADIKDVWEPARFSWAFILAQAYHLNRDEKYPAFFWEQFDAFFANNPPNIGPHWMNGQEVALRLIAWVFAWQVFYKSPKSTTDRTGRLQAALAAHARRISATLIYARSQRNNHLLSEAAGLYTAALMLPGVPSSLRWKKVGWNLFIQATRDQITSIGGYIQQSVNYHRLMLQLAIWIQAVSKLEGANALPEDVISRITAAIHWLEQMIMSETGKTPNMGANDGANILPLGSVEVSDYRPVIQLANKIFHSGMIKTKPFDDDDPEQVVLMKEGGQTACLRVAHYHGRPSHADQLHLDLWWNDRNIALDTGTYRYNYAAPWRNVFAGTVYHNTVSVNNLDQMLRAGRFLWLREARIHDLGIQRGSSGQIQAVTAEHDGYRASGAMHARRVTAHPGNKPGWLVEDDIYPVDGIPTTVAYAIRLAWLMPDWEWELNGLTFQLITPSGIIHIDYKVTGASEDSIHLNVHRAGESLTTTHVSDPTWGWYSPTYAVKEPALAVHLTAQGTLPIRLSTHWRLPV
jgi:hypothetical protein